VQRTEINSPDWICPDCHACRVLHVIAVLATALPASGLVTGVVPSLATNSNITTSWASRNLTINVQPDRCVINVYCRALLSGMQGSSGPLKLHGLFQTWPNLVLQF
jgi:hypothetical protein